MRRDRRGRRDRDLSFTVYESNHNGQAKTLLKPLSCNQMELRLVHFEKALISKGINPSSAGKIRKERPNQIRMESKS